MFAFSASTPIVSTKAALGKTSFVNSLESRPRNVSAAPTMALRVGIRKAAGLASSRFGGVNGIYEKADEYMANSVLYQYYTMANPSGVYGVQCTEGNVKGAADAARVRSLNCKFRDSQKGAAKKYFDMYEFRREAVHSDHICSVEAKQFCTFTKMAQVYVRARAEGYGTCDRYATPESVEEAAMVRYMDIQQKCCVNPTGVYNSSCVEGAAKGQAEDLRVATLGAAFRNGQKPTGQLLREKYEQRKFGYVQCNGCSYEESIVTKYPAVGACFRNQAYGY